jgi:hypothetical protein
MRYTPVAFLHDRIHKIAASFKCKMNISSSGVLFLMLL